MSPISSRCSELVSMLCTTWRCRRPTWAWARRRSWARKRRFSRSSWRALQVDRQFDDLRPAPAVLFAERLAWYLGQVEFDGAVEGIDVVVQAAQFLAQRRLAAAQDFQQVAEHGLDQAADAQGFKPP